MDTTLTPATGLKLGDTLALRHGGTRRITGLDVLPHVVRIRTGRSTHWMRANPEALLPVVRAS